VFVYCPEQWRLEHGLGLKPVAALDAGDRHHAGKAIAERGGERATHVPLVPESGWSLPLSSRSTEAVHMRYLVSR